MKNTVAKALSPELLKKMDAHWRAANYLSVGQIYLYDNPLLRQPLTREHIKPRLLGHWGTTSALAMAIQMGATIYDLEEAELCYAPQFGSAKDPVNFAGVIAADVLRGDMPLSHWDPAEKGFLLDVREPVELTVENVPEALNIPLGQLRARLGELPRDRDTLVICRSGQRAYIATRMLLQKGFKAKDPRRGHAVANSC